MHKRKRRLFGNEDEDEDENNEDKTDLIKCFENRIYFHGAVSKQNILKLIEFLDKANNYVITHNISLNNSYIYLYINSFGGEAYAGLSGMDHIQRNKIPVITIADGFVASAATFLLLGGNVRYGMPNCTVLIHQLSTGFWGKYAELQDEMKNADKLMEKIRKLYEQKTNIPQDRLKQLLSKEIEITFDECLSSDIFYAM